MCFEEIWKDIKDYEGIYQVSNLGDVKSLPRRTMDGRFIKGRIRRYSTDKYGYRQIVLSKDKVDKTFRICRLVAIAFILNSENKPEVNHKNGIKINDNEKNLEWATHKENIIHRDNILGRHTRGERSGMAKLNEVKVIRIRYLLRNSNLTQQIIAKMFGINKVTINDINIGKTWRHLK